MIIDVYFHVHNQNIRHVIYFTKIIDLLFFLVTPKLYIRNKRCNRSMMCNFCNEAAKECYTRNYNLFLSLFGAKPCIIALSVSRIVVLFVKRLAHMFFFLLYSFQFGLPHNPCPQSYVI